MADRPPRIVKFVKAEISKVGDKCRAHVELRRDPDRSYFGTADGPCDEPGNLWPVAQATANALLQAATSEPDSPAYEIRVKELAVQENFGNKMVLVAVAGSYFNQRRDLLGLCAIDKDPVKSAALAVLNATNRFLGVG